MAVCTGTGALTTAFPRLNLFGIVCTAAGYLIVSAYHENKLAINIACGEAEEIACGFSTPQGLALDEADRTVYVADSQHHQIKCVELPDRFLAVSTDPHTNSAGLTVTYCR